LWLGWNGFNGGDPYFANADAGAAVLNTNIATAVSLLCWLVLDMFAIGKPSAVSMINGMIAGLVAITPGCRLRRRFRRDPRRARGRHHPVVLAQQDRPSGRCSRKVDDTFSVLHTHGVAGARRRIDGRLVANPAMVEYLTTDPKGSPVTVAGLFYGNPKQLVSQAFAAAVIIVWNIIGTFVVLKLISFVVPLRASDGEVEGGDLAIHGIDPMRSTSRRCAVNS
jgi:Amt family ammonium transporter